MFLQRILRATSAATIPTTSTSTTLARAFASSAPSLPAIEDVKFSLDNRIAIITLNRPKRMNALSEAMGESVIRLCEYISALPVGDVRACIIQGDERSFSTGRDLKISKTHTTLAQRKHYLGLALNSVLTVHKLPVPTIAAMSGFSFGWGTEIALGCDMRVATAGATLCLPETGLGIIPGAAGCVLLRELVSPSIAKDLIYTARRISGEEAHALGVVNYLDPDPNAKAKAIACRISCNGPLGVRAAKVLIDSCQNMEFDEAIELSVKIRGPLSETQDFNEALAAFEEKRMPVFQGR